VRAPAPPAVSSPTAADEIAPDLLDPWTARPFRLDHDPEDYLRIVANPFLAFFVLAAAIGVLFVPASMTFANNLKGVLVPLLFITALLLHTRFYQYHCLDCGTTGRLTRWKSHSCPLSDERRRLGRKRRLRGPTPAIQVIAWIYVVCMVAVIVQAHFSVWSSR
jgi:hypothetical protein